MKSDDGSRNNPASRINAAVAVIFSIWLFFTWIAAWEVELFIEKSGYGLDTSSQRFLYWLCMKLLLWILPSMILLRKAHLILWGMDGSWQIKRVGVWGIVPGTLLGISAIMSRLFSGNNIFATPLGWTFLGGVVIAPVFEEITFRGAIMKMLNQRYGFWMSNLITSFFFLMIHLPGWYYQGCLYHNLTDPFGGALSIMVMGLIFGYVVKRSGSVVSGIICHSINNLCNT